MGKASMKVFVAGKSGQVAQSLVDAAPEHFLDITCAGRDDIDLFSLDACRKTISELRPGAIINAAAYTAVDEAESDIQAATALNRDAAANLATIAAELGIPFLHISTDYVFDGTKGDAYTETDKAKPTGVYGQSKLDGEKAVQAANPDAMIFRTAWIYSPYGKNFLKTMLRLAETREELGVVSDQTGSPTYALDIAHALLTIIQRIREQGWQPAYAGVFHMTAHGSTSWHGFAKEIFTCAKKYQRKKPKVNAITTNEFPTPTKRPANSVLDNSKLEKVFCIQLPWWQDGTARCVYTLFH